MSCLRPFGLLRATPPIYFADLETDVGNPFAFLASGWPTSPDGPGSDISKNPAVTSATLRRYLVGSEP